MTGNFLKVRREPYSILGHLKGSWFGAGGCRPGRVSTKNLPELGSWPWLPGHLGDGKQPQQLSSPSSADVVCLYQVLAFPHLSLLCPSRRKLGHPQAPPPILAGESLGSARRASWEGVFFCTPAQQRGWHMCACKHICGFPSLALSPSTPVCLCFCLLLSQHLWVSLCLFLWLSFLCFLGLLFIFMFVAHCIIIAISMLVLSPQTMSSVRAKAVFYLPVPAHSRCLIHFCGINEWISDLAPESLCVCTFLGPCDSLRS